jgi:hypothetical protein
MSKKVKAVEDIQICACCKNCRYWNRKIEGNFGLCRKIKVGKDVRIAGYFLQTGSEFMCMYNEPKAIDNEKLTVEILTEQKETQNDNTNINNSTDIIAD